MQYPHQILLQSALAFFLMAPLRADKEQQVGGPDAATKLQLEYYPNKRLARISCDDGPVGRQNCRYGDTTGEVKTFYKSGKVQQILRFSHGLRDGITETYSPSSGKRARNERWVAGVREGLTEDFWDNGHVMEQTVYKNGKSDGTLKKYFSDGSIAEESTVFDGEIQTERTYYQNGRVKAETVRTGKSIAVKEFWDNGHPQFEGIFVEKMRSGTTGEVIVTEAMDPLLDGTIEYNPWGGDLLTWKDFVEQGVHKHYYEDGPIEDEITYQAGLREGLSKSYYPDGKLATESQYTADHLAHQKEFDKTGKLVRDEKYHEDGSRKQ